MYIIVKKINNSYRYTIDKSVLCKLESTLQFNHFEIFAFLGHEGGMGSLFSDLSIVDQDDRVGCFYCLESVCNNNDRTSGKQCIERFGNRFFVFTI